MPKRRPLTAADYAAMAICPSLIVLMLAALMHFVILCLYRGPYSSRLTYILFMFIMGATGIARISIEFGRSHASLYAGALGLAVVVVLGTFTNFFFAVFAVALVWFLADRITFDCTVIDEGKDASGEGLIESGGLFGGKRPQASPDVSLDGTTDRGEQTDGEGATAGPAADQDCRKRRKKNKKVHKPGKTVFYLALAALPMFGLGQLVLPPGDGVRSQAAMALGLYLFATLTLLVVTSFLGLRRYLRQRGAEMPSDVAIAWVAGGAALTALLLTACFALPMPGHLLAVAELPKIESPDWLSPSRFGWGGEGVDNDGSTDGDAARVTDPASENPPGSATDEQGQTPGGTESQGKSGSQESASNKSGGQQESSSSESDSQGPSGSDSQSSNTSTSASRSSESQSSGDQSGQGTSASSQESSGGDAGDPSVKGGGDEGSSESSQASSAGEDQQNGSKSLRDPSGRQSGSREPQEDDTNKEDQRGDQQTADQESGTPPSRDASQSEQTASSDSGETSSSSKSSSSWSPPNVLPAMGTMFKVIVFLVLLSIIALFLHKNPQIWRQWLDALAAIFRRPDRKSKASETDEASPLAEVVQRPFGSFQNPLSEEVDPRRAIVVTFQAFDAWAREHGHPRHEDETPAEFAARFGHQHPPFTHSLPRLADAYNRIVYGRSPATKKDIAAASSLWELMRSTN